MPRIHDENRELWLWLLNDGGAWTSAELAERLGLDPEAVYHQVSQMAQPGADLCG